MRIWNSHDQIIRIQVEKGRTGKLLVSSPDVPLFHLAITSYAEMQSLVLPLLKETLERRLKREIALRPVDVFDGNDSGDSGERDHLTHVIADLAA